MNYLQSPPYCKAKYSFAALNHVALYSLIARFHYFIAKSKYFE